MDLKSTYNKIAKDWMQDHHGDTWWVEGTDKYLSFFDSNASILDVGCGAGEKSKYLVKKGFRVTGIDFSEEMIALAKQQVPAGKFFVKDIKQSLRLEETFDGVFAQAVLLHISKKEVIGVIKNIIKPLKTGGYFYVAVKELRSGKPDEEIVKENDYGYDYERFFSYFTLEEIKGYVTEIGMSIVFEIVASSGKTNWIQIIAKKV
jgi:SAM-dependent methyltransferase